MKSCVICRQPPLLGRGRDRNQESKSKSRPGSRRGERSTYATPRAFACSRSCKRFSGGGNCCSLWTGYATKRSTVQLLRIFRRGSEGDDSISQVAITSRLTISLFFAICILFNTKCVLINYLSRRKLKVKETKIFIFIFFNYKM